MERPKRFSVAAGTFTVSGSAQMREHSRSACQEPASHLSPKCPHVCSQGPFVKIFRSPKGDSPSFLICCNKSKLDYK